MLNVLKKTGGHLAYFIVFIGVLAISWWGFHEININITTNYDIDKYVLMLLMCIPYLIFGAILVLPYLWRENKVQGKWKFNFFKLAIAVPLIILLSAPVICIIFDAMMNTYDFDSTMMAIYGAIFGNFSIYILAITFVALSCFYKAPRNKRSIAIEIISHVSLALAFVTFILMKDGFTVSYLYSDGTTYNVGNVVLKIIVGVIIGIIITFPLLTNERRKSGKWKVDGYKLIIWCLPIIAIWISILVASFYFQVDGNIGTYILLEGTLAIALGSFMTMGFFKTNDAPVQNAITEETQPSETQQQTEVKSAE